jgi:AhpD family alkylhydroperoxidase
MRLNPFAAAPAPMKAWLDFSLNPDVAVEPRLAELVKIRASQINGCANCLAMHARDARAHGESEERIWLLDAWREAPCYSEAERAALAWTEALTRIADARAPDPVYAELARHFSEEEQVALTLLIVTINGWNRIAVGFGLFDPGASAATAA